MRTIHVEYHREGDSWWADSPDVPGWVAGGDSLAEARDLAREGLPFFVEDEVDLLEQLASPSVLVHVDWAWSGVEGAAFPATSASVASIGVLTVPAAQAASRSAQTATSA